MFTKTKRPFVGGIVLKMVAGVVGQVMEENVVLCGVSGEVERLSEAGVRLLDP